MTEKINNIYGLNLNCGLGYSSFEDAKLDWEPNNPPIGTLWKINDTVYQVRMIAGRPCFDFYEQ